MWQKALKHGIQGKTFDIIKNMYNEIKSCVTVNGCSSTFFKCQQGVRQDKNLSPLLFSTVNPEIFARVLFSPNFAYAKFRENKILAK